MNRMEISPWLMEKIQIGETVLFLGAGAARGAKSPSGATALTGFELRDRLSDKFLGGKLKEKSLVQVADYAKYDAGLSEVQSFIGSLFMDLEPADFHLLIPTFRWLAIITTNYDLVIEKAYERCSARLQTPARIIRDGDNFGRKNQRSKCSTISEAARMHSNSWGRKASANPRQRRICKVQVQPCQSIWPFGRVGQRIPHNLLRL